MATVTHQRHAGGRPRTRKHSPLFRLVEAMAERRGLTLDQVAEAAGVSVNTLYRINDPRVSKLSAIAAALGEPVGRMAKKAAACAASESREVSR